jgi:hypothetical protein
MAADIVIDATGDGDIAARAGAPFMGPADKGDRMGMSLMYILGGLPANSKDFSGGIRLGDRVVKWGPGFPGDGLDVENLTKVEVESRLKLWDQVQNLKKGRGSLYLSRSPPAWASARPGAFRASTPSPSRMRSTAHTSRMWLPSARTPCRAITDSGSSSATKASTFPIVLWSRRRSKVWCSPAAVSPVRGAVPVRLFHVRRRWLPARSPVSGGSGGQGNVAPRQLRRDGAAEAAGLAKRRAVL